MKKISIIGSNGIPAAYGGFETLVEQLVRNVPKKYSDYKLVVYCSGKGTTKNYLGATLKYVNIKPNGISSISYDIISMIRAAFDKSDCILILGLSGALFIPFYKFFFSGRVITNVDGIEWRREKFSFVISLFLKFSELISVKFSDEIISDNEGIADYIFNKYGRKSTVIPYGGDHVNYDEVSNKSVSNDYKNLNFLGLCRIEPENNIDMILEAFSQVSECNITFIGNWNNSNYGKQLKEKYSNYKNINLKNPIYDQLKLSHFRNECVGYVHGHSAGGTNPSLVEAMYFSKYIFCFDCNFNRYTTENKADFFRDTEELTKLLKKFLENNLSENGDLFNKIAKQRYNWATISNAYFRLL